MINKIGGITFPLFNTSIEEKKILRDLEIHLILNPDTYLFGYLEKQAHPTDKMVINIYYAYVDPYYNLAKKFLIAFINTNFKYILDTGLALRIIITQLLAYKSKSNYENN